MTTIHRPPVHRHTVHMHDTIDIAPDIQLTPFRAEDKPKLVRYLNDETVARNTLTIPYPYTEKDADAWLDLVKKGILPDGISYGRLRD